MSAEEVSNAVLHELRQRYPWPETRPKATPIDWSLDGGGRWMVEELLHCRDLKVVLEIGSFLGGSIRNWLDASPQVMVVAVDPWPEFDVARSAQQYGKSESVIGQLSGPDGMYNTFLANLWDDRARVIPVRESSPAFLHELHDIGLKPDLIFLDSDKIGSEIQLCHRLFPEALLTGDDWGWTNESGACPIQGPVKDFCQRNDRYLRVENATWIIDTQPASVRFRIRTLRRSVQQKWKAMRRRAA